MTTVAALCSGYGGLELALTHAGIPHTLAWYAEIDPAASTVMAHHTDAPNLGDLRDITHPPAVDIITAGFPCQPVSTAGRRAGVDDERWLIRDVVTVWRASGARWLILENVWGLLSANDGRAFGEVLDALAEVGATARWACLRAADVGAPHGRLRWFCVAHAQHDGWDGAEVGRSAGDGQTQGWLLESERRDSSAATDADSGEPERRGGPGVLGSPPATEPGEGLQRQRPGHPTRDRRATPTGDDPDRCSSAGTWGQYAPAVHRWERILGRPAPDPTIDGRLNPVMVEWMMGLPPGWVTDCGLSRTQALRVLGNGVVPQQAAAALHQIGAAAA